MLLIKKTNMGGRCAYSSGKEKRNFRVTNPKGERKEKASKQGGGRKDAMQALQQQQQADGWTDRKMDGDGQREKERKQEAAGTHACAGCCWRRRRR